MPYKHRARQKSPYPFKKRFRYFLSRLSGTRLQRSQNLLFVAMNGQHYKRLILRDSYIASTIEDNLERFGPSEHFPALVIRYEHEVWVEFIEGPTLRDREVDEQLVAMLADFYAAVCSRNPRQVDLSETPFPDRLQRDLHFLRQMDLLTEETYRYLEALAQRLMPLQVWVGFDYIDPVKKNLVIARDSGRICAIDVESLLDGQLIGTGVAKAFLRWLEPFRAEFFDHLARPGVPDIRPYYAFVELCFLAAWTKMGFLEKKWKYLDPAHFDRFRGL